MRASVRPHGHPATQAAPRSKTSGPALPTTTGLLRLCALPSAPFWARQYTRLFLANLPGICDDTRETAQLIVSELVTNAARASASTLGVIALSLRPASHRLTIEVRDQSPDLPVLVRPDRDAEHGRGLMLVDALSEEWGYTTEPIGGKVVYAILRCLPTLSRHPPHAVQCAPHTDRTRPRRHALSPLPSRPSPLHIAPTACALHVAPCACACRLHVARARCALHVARARCTLRVHVAPCALHVARARCALRVARCTLRLARARCA